MLLLLAITSAACDPQGGEADGPAVLELGDRTVELAPGVALVEVRLDGTPNTPDLQPAAVTARPGDVVRFTAADPRGHAIVFDDTALTPEQRAFLDGSGQLRGPPLISAGATWIVSLEGAPPGAYPFLCLNHDARGTLTIGG